MSGNHLTALLATQYRFERLAAAVVYRRRRARALLEMPPVAPAHRDHQAGEEVVAAVGGEVLGPVLYDEVDSLVEVILAKNPATLQVTKYFLDKGADLDLASSMIFEVAPPRQLERQGIADFVEKGSRDQRRKLVMDFWQD